VYALLVAKGGAKIQASDEPGGRQQGMRMGRGQLTAMKVGMDMFASILSGQLSRTVLDKTELAGKYSFKLEWTPEAGEGYAPEKVPPPASESPAFATGADGPSLFTALREQLGLRLEAQRGPVETIVIDHVERPSEN